MALSNSISSRSDISDYNKRTGAKSLGSGNSSSQNYSRKYVIIDDFACDDGSGGTYYRGKVPDNMAEVPLYIDYLIDNGLIYMESDEINDILTWDYEDTMEYINDAIDELAQMKADYYNQAIGLPVTDELIEILKKPNSADSKELMDYSNKHFPEFHKTYVDGLIANGLEFTDGQMSYIRRFTNFSGLQEYLSTITMEATFRYNSRKQAEQEYEKRSMSLTGYSVDDIVSGEAVRLLTEEKNRIDSQLRGNYSLTESEAINLDYESYNLGVRIAACNRIKKAIDNRTNFLTESFLLKSSGELDDVSLYGNITGNDFFEATWDNCEVLDFYQVEENGEKYYKLKYKEWYPGGTEYVIHDEYYENLGCIIGWQVKADFLGNGEPILSQDIYKYKDQVNMIALAKYCMYIRDTQDTNFDNYKLAVALGGDRTIYNLLFNDEQGCGSALMTLISTMTDEEVRIYNYKFEKEGYEAAEQYLKELTDGVDFRQRLGAEIALEGITLYAEVNEVDYSKMTELTDADFVDLYNLYSSDSSSDIEVVNSKIQEYLYNNTLSVVDEEGNEHYYFKDENALYILKEENGERVYYEAKCHDWPAAVNYCNIVMKGFSDGISGFFGGIGDFFSETDPEYSAKEIAQSILTQAMSLYDGGKTVYSVSSGVGRAIPSMVISLVPGVGEYAAIGLNWTSRVGTAKEQTIKQGYTVDKAWEYALASGSIDAAVDVFARNIPGLNKVVGHANKYFATSVLKSAFGASAGYVGDKLLRDWILGESFEENFSWEEMGEQALNSALVTGILNFYKIPNDVRAVKNFTTSIYTSVKTSHDTKTRLREEYGLTNKEARIANNLINKQGYSENDALDVINLMKINVDGKTISRSDAVVLHAMGKVLNITEADLVKIYEISEKTGLSMEESAFSEQLMKSNGIELEEAVLAYRHIKDFGIKPADAFKLAALQKIGVDVDFTKLGDANYIKDIVAIGELAIFSDIDSIDKAIASGEITQEQVTQFLKTVVGDQFDDWIKDDSKVGYILYSNFKKSTEKAGITMDKALKNVDLLRAMMGYYSDARDYLNKPTDLKEFRDAYVFNKQASHFDTYRTHGVIHVLDVYSMSMETYAEFSKINPDLDYDTIAIAAMMHDTGMSGKFEMVSDKNGKIIWKDMARTQESDILSVSRWRGEHSANSGRIILENRDVLHEFGYDDLQIAEAALLAFVHSKSNSGVKTLTDNDNGWSFAINALAECSDDFDFLGVLRENGKITGVADDGGDITIGKVGKPDTYEFKYDKYTFDSDWIEKMAYESLIVRIGDALTNNDNGMTNQYGDIIHIDYENYKYQLSISDTLKTYNIDTIDGSVYDKDTLESLADKESENIKYTIGDGDRAKEMSNSQKFVLGEDNQTYSIRTNPETGGIEVVVSIKSANNIPFCTLYAVNERLGELDSRGPNIFKADAANNLSLVIEFSEMPNSDVRALYEGFRDNLSTTTPIIINYPSTNN